MDRCDIVTTLNVFGQLGQPILIAIDEQDLCAGLEISEQIFITFDAGINDHQCGRFDITQNG